MNIKIETVRSTSSVSGKEYSYTVTRLVYDEDEKRERRRESNRRCYEHERMAREYEYERNLLKTSMEDILAAYDEYVDTVLRSGC